jgi:hypothetical protein
MAEERNKKGNVRNDMYQWGQKMREKVVFGLLTNVD